MQDSIVIDIRNALKRLKLLNGQTQDPWGVSITSSKSTHLAMVFLILCHHWTKGYDLSKQTMIDIYTSQTYFALMRGFVDFSVAYASEDSPSLKGSSGSKEDKDIRHSVQENNLYARIINSFRCIENLLSRLPYRTLLVSQITLTKDFSFCSRMRIYRKLSVLFGLLPSQLWGQWQLFLHPVSSAKNYAGINANTMKIGDIGANLQIQKKKQVLL